MGHGWKTQRLANWRVSDDVRAHEGDFAIYAEPLFAEAVVDQLGLCLMEPPMDWLAWLPREMRHRGVCIRPLSQARLEVVHQFVKPAEGKVFEPKVYASGADLPTLDQVGDIPVLISDLVTFTLEVRCFVLEGTVVTASPYWRDGALAQDADGSWPFLAGEEAEALGFARTVLEHPGVASPPAFVLDVGITSEHGWAVIEGNPCWGAGLYGCDPWEALQTGRRAILKKKDAAVEDLRWVASRASES